MYKEKPYENIRTARNSQTSNKHEALSLSLSLSLSLLCINAILKYILRHLFSGKTTPFGIIFLV